VTFASFQGVPSGWCLNYTAIGGPGNGPCPPKTTGFSSSSLLAGTFANGASVTSLYAQTNATLSRREEATVAVIDNATGAMLLSCAVNATSNGSCSTATGSGPAAPGDKIEVRVTRSGSSSASSSAYDNEQWDVKQWDVRFRY
jgi:hypothetical protein